MRLLHVLWTALPVLGLSSQVLAAPASSGSHRAESPKSAVHGHKSLEKVALHTKGGSHDKDRAKKVEAKKNEAKKAEAKKAKVSPRLERASVVRTEERVRVELSVRGTHGSEPSDAELMEWLSHGAPRAGKPVAKKDEARGGIERAGVRRGGAPKVEKTAAHKSTDKKADKVEKAAKPEAKVEKTDKADKPEPKVEKTERPETKADKKSDKKAKPETKSEKIVREEKKKTEAVCMGPVIDILRGTETDKVALTRCNGKADEQGVLRLSVMARPGQTARPTTLKSEEDLGAAIKKIDNGLAERIATLSSHFATTKGPAAIEVISGYRPGSKGSYHSHARAMDIRVQGARNEDVVAFCKTMNDTGCGYYPNSGFVHVDVRDPGTGHISWIDASGPGETPRYVATWPAPKSTDKGDAPETGSAKAKTAPVETSEKVEAAADKIDGAAEKGEVSEKAEAAVPAKPEAKTGEKSEKSEKAETALPATKPESKMPARDKAKPDSEQDLPKLPPPASGD